MPCSMLFSAASNRKLVRRSDSLGLPPSHLVGAEHLDRACHGANLVAAVGSRDKQRRIAGRKLVHHGRQPQDRPRDAASHGNGTEQREQGGAETKRQEQFPRLPHCC